MTSSDYEAVHIWVLFLILFLIWGGGESSPFLKRRYAKYFRFGFNFKKRTKDLKMEFLAKLNLVAGGFIPKKKALLALSKTL